MFELKAYAWLMVLYASSDVSAGIGPNRPAGFPKRNPHCALVASCELQMPVQLLVLVCFAVIQCNCGTHSVPTAPPASFPPNLFACSLGQS